MDQADLVHEEEDTQSGKYLTFFVDGMQYGIGIRHVTEIIGVQPINSLPEVPIFIKGIINLRGKIIPVMDMRLRFGKAEVPYTDRTCIVVAETERLTAGLIVDQVSEVIVIDEQNVEAPPDVQGDSRYICGIGKTGTEVTLLLDCERLFDGTDNQH